MRKKVEYDLEYRVGGEKKTKKIVIDFVPNKRHEDFALLQSEIYEVQVKWNNIRLLQQEVELLILEKPQDFMENIDKFKTEIETLSKDIKTISDGSLLKRRFELLQSILIDNGYSEDKDLMSWFFWDEHVDPSTINELLTLAIYKDIDKKKVLH